MTDIESIFKEIYPSLYSAVNEYEVIHNVFCGNGGHVYKVPYLLQARIFLNGKIATIDWSDSPIKLAVKGGRIIELKTPELIKAMLMAGSCFELADILAVDSATIRRWDKKPLTKMVRLALSALEIEILTTLRKG